VPTHTALTTVAAAWERGVRDHLLMASKNGTAAITGVDFDD